MTDTHYWPVQRRKVYEQVSDQLLWQISNGYLRPGDALPPERELAERFEVGRSSIREALRILQSQGVIEATGGSYAVSTPANPLNSSLQLLFKLDDRAGMRDLFELRRILDCEAAELAASRHTERDLGEMMASIEEMTAALEEHEVGDRFIDADLRFHLALGEASANRLLVHSMDAVRGVVRRALLSVSLIPQSPERALFEHREIHAAIAAGDPERARRGMRTHLERVESDIERAATRI
jgi:GntR family transcriptional repressor for pyruvate dehydrogenase complex